MMLEHLRPEELEEMRRLGSSIVEGKDFGENMRPDLMEKVARVHHDFWILNRSLNGMRHMWKAPGYVDHWGHELWDKGLSQQAKDADFIQARAHCRTLALLDDDTFGQIVAWAAEKEAA